MVGDSTWFVVISEEELNSGDAVGSWTEFNRNSGNHDSKIKRIVVEEDRSIKSYPDWVPTNSLPCSLLYLPTDLRRCGPLKPSAMNENRGKKNC